MFTLLFFVSIETTTYLIYSMKLGLFSHYFFFGFYWNYHIYSGSMSLIYSMKFGLFSHYFFFVSIETTTFTVVLCSIVCNKDCFHIIFFLVSIETSNICSFCLSFWFNNVVDQICHGHCRKIGWYSSPDLSHTLSENWMIRLNWYVTHIVMKFNIVVDLICHGHCID